MLTAKERYESFIKNTLTPFFKSKGFKKKGTKYIFYGKELAYVFFPLRGKYTDRDHVYFSIYFELHSTTFENKQDLNSYVFTLVAGSISDFIKNRKIGYDTFKTGEEDAEKKDKEIAEYFLDSLENDVLPYVLKFQTIQDIIHLLETTPEKERFWAGAVFTNRVPFLYWFLGEKEKAVHCVNNLIEGINTRVKAPSLREGVFKNLSEMKERIIKGPDRYIRENESSVV